MAKKDKAVKAAKPAKAKEPSNDERILTLLEGLSKDVGEVKAQVADHERRFAQQDHTAIPKPSSFEVMQDKNVPPEISKIVREVLGNDIGIEVRTVVNDATGKIDQTQMDVIIPEKYHTRGQYNTYHQQREEVTRDENGRIIKREIVPFVVVDRRTLPVQGIISSGAFNDEIHRFALRVAEQIRGEFEKSKLAPPNFFA